MTHCGFESGINDVPYFWRKNVLPEPWLLHQPLPLRIILGGCLWCPCARLCTHRSLEHLNMPLVRHKDMLHRVWPEITRGEGIWTFGQGGVLLLDPDTLQSSPALTQTPHSASPEQHPLHIPASDASPCSTVSFQSRGCAFATIPVLFYHYFV